MTHPPGFSSLAGRISGPSVSAWDIHYEAMAAARRGEDVIVLSVGDPDFPTPGPIIEAAVTALRAGDTHYTPLAGYPELRQAIAREHQRVSGQAVGPENVIFTAGAQNALAAVALTILERGDEVLVPEPMYLTYAASIGLTGATLVPVAQPPALGLRLDLDGLARAVTARTRAIFFATPNNPSGVVMSREELDFIAALAISRDLWVVADEVYATITFERPHLSIASLPQMAPRTVTISSVSKSHAMAGWRAGWAVGPVVLIEHLVRIAQCTLYGLPGFVQAGVLAALEHGRAAQQAMRETYRGRRDLVLGLLAVSKRLRCLRPEAGMFMLVDITRTGLSADAFVRRLYRATGVSVLDAGAFGPSAADYIRVSFANGNDRLAEACARILGFVDSLPESPAQERA
ncbi:MAG TPA: aminotransferase class I/II-fold pyridoxal phosphate-dependent enzyme [Steroidobacteraceae bacterium]